MRQISSKLIVPLRLRKIFLFIAALCCAVMVNAQATYQITISPAEGESFNLSVAPIDDIASIKLQIQDLKSIPTNQQMLIFAGKLLQDAKCVADYNIQAGATVYLRFVAHNEQGALGGKFSVAADKQVQFSKGNLQYNKYEAWWQFAENQWDTIGGDNTYVNVIDDAEHQIIDLFGWGTGNNPTLATYPSADYSPFIDWGPVAAEDMGLESTWRTLTADEMEYLLHTRSTTLFGMGTVNNVKGLIILPDNWVLPDGLSFEPSTAHGLVYEGGSYSNSGATDNFQWNTYTLQDWAVMASAGAVFLPAAGNRACDAVDAPCTTIYDVNAYGLYWTSTPTGSDAYALMFSKTGLHPHRFFTPNRGFSVRLVHDVPTSATALDNTAAEGKAVKRIVNGQLLIEKNGKIVNVLGLPIR